MSSLSVNKVLRTTNVKEFVMKKANKFTFAMKAICVFVFGICITTFNLILNFLFFDTSLKTNDPLSKSLPQASWTGIDETTDEGVKVVSKDGFIDY